MSAPHAPNEVESYGMVGKHNANAQVLPHYPITAGVAVAHRHAATQTECPRPVRLYGPGF